MPYDYFCQYACISARTCLFFFLAIVFASLDDDGRRKEYGGERGKNAASSVCSESELEFSRPRCDGVYLVLDNKDDDLQDCELWPDPAAGYKLLGTLNHRQVIKKLSSQISGPCMHVALPLNVLYDDYNLQDTLIITPGTIFRLLVTLPRPN